MSIKLVSWNIEGRLSRFSTKGRGTPEHILRGISDASADIVFLPEASDGDNIDREIINNILELGYQTHTVDYEEKGKDRRWAAVPRPNMKLLTRLPVRRFRKVRLGDIRNALVAEIDDPGSGHSIRIIGVHLDDRNEIFRIQQIEDLIRLVSASDIPTVVMGDFNAMHVDDYRARLLRGKMFRLFISKFPHARTRDMLGRLSEMASGNSLILLETGTSLRDADSYRRATTTPKLRFQEWMPSIRLVQIDHMYVSESLTVSDFKVGRDGGSDHRPICATAYFPKEESGQNKSLVL